MEVNAYFTPDRFNLGEGAHGIKGTGILVGPKFVLDWVVKRKSSVPAGNRSTTAQSSTSLPSQYSDWAIPAHIE
jgi:hypothetical protein